MDERKVNTTLINRWIERAGKNGLGKLSIRADVSQSVIAHARTGAAPAKTDTRQKIANALGLSEDEVFPLVSASESAS